MNSTKVTFENTIKVPPEILIALEAVCKSGTTNMFDVSMVCLQAVALGYPEAANWISENKTAYTEGVFTGFESELDTNNDNALTW